MPSLGNLALLKKLDQPARFQACGLTHPGLVREENEDSWLVDDGIGLAIAADGVGGHGDGAWASKAAARLIGNFVRRVCDKSGAETFADPAAQDRVIRRAIRYAHRRMITDHLTKETKKHRRGSTIVGLWAPAGATGAATVFHVGDSRLYLLRQGKLLQLTRDHSAYEQWCSTGRVGQAPSKKYILQALGLSDHVEPTVQTIVPLARDRVLICTDGLTGSVEDEDLFSLIGREGDLSSACEALIALGLAHQAQDNLTAVLCTFRSG